MKTPPNGDPIGLTNNEIIRIVNQWIGVDGGYLGDFNYRTHDEFWLEECDITISTGWYEGTTRECFIDTLSNASSRQQAAALDALLVRFTGARNPDQNEKLRIELGVVVERLRTGEVPESLSGSFTPGDGYEAVARAINDARELIKSSGGYSSAVDRMHTALHGYLRSLATEHDPDLKHDSDMVASWKSLLNHHPAFHDFGARHNDIKTALKSLSAVVNVLNPIRNRASNAHPNESVLDEPEAMFVVHTTHSIALFVQSRVRKFDT